MKSDKLLESTQKSLQNKLQEDTNTMELEVNIQELINQGIQKLQDDVDIKCTLIKIYRKYLDKSVCVVGNSASDR